MISDVHMPSCGSFYLFSFTCYPYHLTLGTRNLKEQFYIAVEQNDLNLNSACVTLVK